MTFFAHREQNARRRSWAPANSLTVFLTRLPSSSTSFSVWPTTTPARSLILWITTPAAESKRGRS